MRAYHIASAIDGPLRSARKRALYIAYHATIFFYGRRDECAATAADISNASMPRYQQEAIRHCRLNEVNSALHSRRPRARELLYFSAELRCRFATLAGNCTR